MIYLCIFADHFIQYDSIMNIALVTMDTVLWQHGNS